MLLLRINTLNYKDNSMAKVDFKIAKQDIIAKHKELVENNFNTKVDSNNSLIRRSGWIVFSDEFYVYKSWTLNDSLGEHETRELSYFCKYHRSNLLQDWKLVPPFGCIQKQRKVPGKSLSHLKKQELKQIDIQKFSDWWVAEQRHIHEVGCELSKRYSEFSIPFRKNHYNKYRKYIFCFADLNSENVMIEPETNTYNFVDFSPIGWIPAGHYRCLYEYYLTDIHETITGSREKSEKYLESMNDYLRGIGTLVHE